jgi:hypothetical protein
MSATGHPPLLVERDGPIAILTMTMPEQCDALFRAPSRASV